MTHIPKLNKISVLPIGTIVAIHPLTDIGKSLDSNYWEACDSSGGVIDFTYSDGTQTTGISRPDISDDRFLMGGSTYERDGSNDYLAHTHSNTETTLGAKTVSKCLWNTDQNTHSHTVNETSTGGGTINKSSWNTSYTTHNHAVGGLYFEFGHSTAAATVGYGWSNAAGCTWEAGYAQSSWGPSDCNAYYCGPIVRCYSVTAYPTWVSSTITTASNHTHSVSAGNCHATWTDTTFATAIDHDHSVSVDSVSTTTTGQNRPKYFEVKYYIKIK